ncbi:MAG TPA: fused MFS/spermidine synthase [Solirubrobacteraceae bacterium]|jgi:MFS family permease|nr:fused MFS/spermidine synthase [Solirubrobacteraceae bacterium]
MGTKTFSRPAAADAAATRPTAGSLPPVVAAAVVFIACGAVLVLEILSVRLIAPYVGLTLETTTSIIGAVLAGIAVGAALGGWIADRIHPQWLLVGLLIGGGLLVLLTVPIVRALGPAASEGGNLGAIEITFAALVPVAAVLSGVTPTVARLQLRDLKASGTIVGRLSAWATAGALVGTFGTGFVLVPLFPVSNSVLAIGIMLVLAGILMGAYVRVLNLGSVGGAALITAALALFTLAQRSPCLAESTYNCIQLEPAPDRPSAELLLLNRGYNSEVDPSDPRYLGLQYEYWLGEEITAMSPEGTPLDAVFVGGGGFTMPRWLAATRPGSRSNVLEVDGGLVEFDRQHLGLHTSPALRATVGDARVTMRREPTASANLIVGDAFSSRTVPWQLMTTEWMHELQRVLRPGGIYALNMIDLNPFKLLRAEAATLLGSFTHVQMITVTGSGRTLAGGNEVLVASDGPLPPRSEPSPGGGSTFDRAALTRIVAGAEPLRDDYAPVDQLETR